LTRSRAVRLPLVALLVGVTAALLCACSATDEVAILDTTVVTWPGDDGSTAGQVIVSVRNDGQRPVDPDVLGSGRLTLAHLLDPDGEDLPGGDARVQLHAVPHVIDPGEEGYLIGDFEMAEPADRVADARVELNVAVADAIAHVSVEGFELVEGDNGLGAEGRLEWDGAGTAVARAIALDADGRALGYLATSEVRYDAGDFTMCCFPPTVDRDEIGEVVVFGDQAREEN
jgi:hypothetical protein